MKRIREWTQCCNLYALVRNALSPILTLNVWNLEKSAHTYIGGRSSCNKIHKIPSNRQKTQILLHFMIQTDRSNQRSFWMCS